MGIIHAFTEAAAALCTRFHGYHSFCVVDPAADVMSALISSTLLMGHCAKQYACVSVMANDAAQALISYAASAAAATATATVTMSLTSIGRHVVRVPHTATAGHSLACLALSVHRTSSHH